MVYSLMENKVLLNIEETGAQHEIKDKNSDFFFCNYPFAIGFGRSCTYGFYQSSVIEFGETV